jgi:hypothetical protein
LNRRPPRRRITFDVRLNKMSPEEKWLKAKSEIEEIYASKPRSNKCVAIPRWEPVDIEAGLDWCKKRIYDGWYIAYRDHESMIQLKYWEYGEDEPEWQA